MKILIFGLPDSGKTTLAQALNDQLPSLWFNADAVRQAESDWDFSPAGRQRQAQRMRTLADQALGLNVPYVICDFVAPTAELRNIFQADFSIWMHTVEQSTYADTDQLFEPPTTTNLTLTDFDYDIAAIVRQIIEFN